MTTTRSHGRAVWRARLVNIGLTAAMLVLSLGTGEAVLRSFVRMPLQRILPEVRYAHHPVRRFTLVPGQEAFTYGAPVRIDARGFRVTGDAARGAGGRADVLALGDSFTFGLGVRDEETWPAQLQRELSGALSRPVEVVNAGTISYGVFQELDLLRSSALGSRPRVVVHGLYWNDFMNAGAPEPGAAPVVDANGYLAWDRLSQPRNRLRHATSAAVSSSALLYTLRQAASSVTAGPRDSAYGTAYARFVREGLAPEEWLVVEEFYRELQRLGKEHDFQVIVAIMPVSDIVIQAGDPRAHAYPMAARALLERLDIPYVDAFGLWTEGRSAARHFLPEAADAHLNADGYRLLAGALAKAMFNSGPLRPPSTYDP